MLLYFLQNVFFKSKIILLCVIIAIQHSSSSKTSARKTQLAKQDRGRKRPLRKTRCRKFPVKLVLIENCKKCNVPNCDLTIDEQLFPCKTRCSFIQYMANNPDKFGIKFWLLTDAQSKYLCNGKPYLGRDPS